MFVRNGESRVEKTLDSMAAYCDAVYVLNDRSTDGTLEVLRNHPLVANVFTADPRISSQSWFFSESACLNLLYRMADFYLPDWLVVLADDEIINPAGSLRDTLQQVDEGVAAIKLNRVSSWTDELYPLMVPLMSRARALDGRLWRYFPNLIPYEKPLHNGYLPANIEKFGATYTLPNHELVHGGWDTLANRIEKVDLYSALDSECKYNYGVPYDKGLLFGYTRDQIPALIAEYRRRFDAHLHNEQAVHHAAFGATKEDGGKDD
jgi:glycosyltransferase involved in cell wall biosynthesis